MCIWTVNHWGWHLYIHDFVTISDITQPHPYHCCIWWAVRESFQCRFAWREFLACLNHKLGTMSLLCLCMRHRVLMSHICVRVHAVLPVYFKPDLQDFQTVLAGTTSSRESVLIIYAQQLLSNPLCCQTWMCLRWVEACRCLWVELRSFL